MYQSVTEYNYVSDQFGFEDDQNSVSCMIVSKLWINCELRWDIVSMGFASNTGKRITEKTIVFAQSPIRDWLVLNREFEVRKDRVFTWSSYTVHYWCYHIQFGNPLDLDQCVFGWRNEGIRYSRTSPLLLSIYHHWLEINLI